jgi:hypothetical protein
MRRTIALLVLLLLLLCGASIARAQGDQGQSEVETTRREFVDALKTLKDVAAERLPLQKDKEVAAAIKGIIKRLGQLFPSDEDFASEEKLASAADAIAGWNSLASDTKKIPPGRLAVAISVAFQKSGEYTAAKERKMAKAATPTPSPTPAKPLTLQGVADDVAALQKQVGSQTGILPGWASLSLMGLAALLVVGLFVFTFVSIRQTRRDVAVLRDQTHQAFLSLRTKHEALVKKLEGLTASDADLFTRLAELSAEIGAIDGRMRGLKATAVKPHSDGDGFGPPPPPPPELPAFPVTADAYLRKMQRHATVVKPDFQNGILIADPENKGELVLVQDTSFSHDTLFVVPRAAQFQMKQDFYTYYERYYECERPASGTVWIVDPAVVERVQGGWELREKGVLEVR